MEGGFRLREAGASELGVVPEQEILQRRLLDVAQAFGAYTSGV